MLLERQTEYDCLASAVEALRGAAPRGSVSVVLGEAGIGKTSLLRKVRESSSSDVQWLWGSCEHALRAAPLTPLLDWLPGMPAELAAAVQQGRPMAQMLSPVLQWLRTRSRPLVLVIDDAQWADSATTDLLRYMARRLEGTRVLLLLAAREEALAPGAPLNELLGQLGGTPAERLTLAPLSREAVGELARRAGRAARGLHRITAGNPFFVTECLAGPVGLLPASVRDAVRSRLAGLPSDCIDLLELVAAAPGGLELELASAILEAPELVADAAIAAGLLAREGAVLRFRHEVARQAVESGCGPGRIAALHGALFDVLQLRQAPPARRLHHAECAGLGDAVQQLAPLAAEQAQAAGAFAEAAGLYALALRHGQGLAPGERAALHHARAQCCLLRGDADGAIQALHEALALQRALEEPLAEGISLRLLARSHWLRGEVAAGCAQAERSIACLEAASAPAQELALSYAVMAHMHVMSPTLATAVTWGERALQMLGEEGMAEGRAYAMNTVASSRLRTRDDAQAWAQLQQSIELARQHGLGEQVTRGYVNLLSLQLAHRRLPQALADSEAGIAYCQARDIDLYVARLHTRRAWALMELGRWTEAAAGLQAAADARALGPVEAEQLRHLQALLALRQGRTDAALESYWLQLAQALAARREGLRAEPWFAPQAVAAAEAAWLLGHDALAHAVASAALQAALAVGEPWRVGQLACWVQRCGSAAAMSNHAAADAAAERVTEAGADIAQPALAGATAGPALEARPCALELQGETEAAVTAWHGLGCPYEAALLLGTRPHAPEAWREALRRAETLGAAALAQRLRKQLRAQGVRTRSTGPNRATRADALGLTPRENEVLAAIAAGLSNREIAERMRRSTRTVDHHVAALLAKLGAGGRAEAVAKARLLRAGELGEQNPTELGMPGQKNE
ncbi:hypothetical protein D621_16230 [beta proteobacterium AAP51]|nr:hypothetical protein D621_16230 [beta proteobacterium AAP51]